MACKVARVRLSADEDRRLFAESAGTCLLCPTSLFPDDPNLTRSIAIAERAHVVGHSEDGPRGDMPMTAAERDGAANIVLLCPTCHTIVDKDERAFPVEELLERKRRRARAVAIIGGIAVFATRAEARVAARLVLQRNRLLFESYGPDPDDGSSPDQEHADAWSERVLGEIVPNNRVLIAMVEVNADLASDGDRRAAELLRQHTDDLERKHRSSSVTGRAKRFPPEAEDLFTEAR